MGFETTSEIMDAIPKLSGFTVYYSDISILEATWKIVKLASSENEVRRVNRGLKAIKDTFHPVSIDEKSLSMAMDMYRKSHRDLIDNLLYSTAASEKIFFPTIDRELIDFIKNNNYPAEYIITPSLFKVGAKK